MGKCLLCTSQDPTQMPRPHIKPDTSHIRNHSIPGQRWEAKEESPEASEPTSLVYAASNNKKPCLKLGGR